MFYKIMSSLVKVTEEYSLSLKLLLLSVSHLEKKYFQQEIL